MKRMMSLEARLDDVIAYDSLGWIKRWLKIRYIFSLLHQRRIPTEFKYVYMIDHYKHYTYLTIFGKAWSLR